MFIEVLFSKAHMEKCGEEMLVISPPVNSLLCAGDLFNKNVLWKVKKRKCPANEKEKHKE